MSPFVGLGGARSFCLLHPLFRIDTEDQPHRHFVAVRQLYDYVRDLPRIAFRTPSSLRNILSIEPTEASYSGSRSGAF